MRIVVIENDPGFRQTWVKLLKALGHNVMPFANTDEISATTLHAERYDLALVDRRAHDDNDDLDESGQEFAIELCKLGTPAVLVTGFLPPKLFDLLRTGELTGVAPKALDIAELAACVQEFSLSHRFPNCVARFRWSGQDSDQTFVGADWDKVKDGISNVSREECAVLFRSLIPTCVTSVELEHIPPGHGGAALFRAMVSSGDGPVVEDVAIKYGHQAAIRSEAIRYDRHVGPLPDGVAAHLRWRKEMPSVAAIAYSWVGDSVADGVPFGPVRGGESLSWPRRITALDRLFAVSLNPWYKVFRNATPVERPIKLLDYYVGTDGDCRGVPFSDGALPADVASSIRVAGEYWDFGSAGKLVDPSRWLSTGPGSTLSFTRYCPVHGDLHVRNIFVLPDDSPRLIDFGDTSLGHVFRDFAALEVSIRMACTNEEDLDLLQRAADRVSSVSALGDFVDYRAIPSKASDLRNTLLATMHVRRAALDAVGAQNNEHSIVEYLYAVALRMLRYASGIADEMSASDSPSTPSRTWYALYCAASAATQAERLRKVMAK